VKNEVYVTACSFRLPGLNTMDDIIRSIAGIGSIPELEKKTFSDGQVAEFGKLKLDQEMEYFPQRQDAKVMRRDVLAATICARELIDRIRIAPEQIPEIPLYISSGAFVENLFNQPGRLSETFSKALEITDHTILKEMVYKAIPPLLALNTLTNAASSYVAQYSKIAGRNCTYGNTSAGSGYAIHSAFSEISVRDCKMAVAGATNIGDIYSYLSFNQFSGLSDLWRESTGSALLLFSNRKSAEETSINPISIIEFIKFSKNVPVLMSRTDFDNTYFEELLSEGHPIVFSGAYTTASYKMQLDLFSSFSSECYSWFPLLGNMGAVNNIINILTSIVLIKNSNTGKVISIDKDPYGRETLILIKEPG
jgi:hypothetical protein